MFQRSLLKSKSCWSWRRNIAKKKLVYRRWKAPSCVFLSFGVLGKAEKNLQKQKLLAEIQKLQKQKQKCLFGFPPDTVDIYFTADGKRDELPQPMDIEGLAFRFFFCVKFLCFVFFYLFVLFRFELGERFWRHWWTWCDFVRDKGNVDVNELVFGERSC